MAHIQHPQMQGALDDIYCSTSIICQAKEVHQDSSLINMKLLQALSGNKAYNRNEEFKREDEIQNTAEPYHLFRNLAGIKTSKASQEDNTGAHVMKHKSNNGGILGAWVSNLIHHHLSLTNGRCSNTIQ